MITPIILAILFNRSITRVLSDLWILVYNTLRDRIEIHVLVERMGVI